MYQKNKNMSNTFDWGKDFKEDRLIFHGKLTIEIPSFHKTYAGNIYKICLWKM